MGGRDALRTGKGAVVGALIVNALGGQGTGGEQRVTGTLTAGSGSTVTVPTSSGAATYRLVSQTQIVRDGVLASASDLEAGDRVLVHVFPVNGSDGVLERLIAVSGAGGSGPTGSGPTGSHATGDGTTGDGTATT